MFGSKRKMRELLQYFKLRAQPVQKTCGIQIGRVHLQVQEHGNERIVIRRDRGRRVTRWHRSQQSYERIAGRFNKVLDARLTKKAL